MRSVFFVLLFVFSIARVFAAAPEDCNLYETPIKKGLQFSRELQDYYGQADPRGAKTQTAMKQIDADGKVLDNRERVENPSVYPYSTIAQIRMRLPNGQEQVCTGVMISPCVMATAAHCFNQKGGPVTDAQKDNSRVFFPSREKGLKLSRVERPAKFSYSEDYAFIELDEDVGRKTGFMKLSPKRLDMRFQSVESAGFPTELWDGDILYSAKASQVVSKSREKEILKFEKNHYGVVGTISTGMSGGPLFFMNSKGQAELIGLNQGGLHSKNPVTGKDDHLLMRTGQVKFADRAVRSDAFYDKAMDFMKASKCAKKTK